MPAKDGDPLSDTPDCFVDRWLVAWTGQRFDASIGRLRIAPQGDERLPVILPKGWGYLENGPPGRSCSVCTGR